MKPRLPVTRPPPPKPVRKIRIETPRYLLRTLLPSDASPRWIEWMKDKDVTEPLNAPLRTMTLEDVRAHFATYDQETQLLIGIFTRPENLFIGFYILQLSHTHRTANFNLAIGDKAHWGQKAVLETRAALLDFVFDTIRVEKAFGTPICRNFPAIFNYKAQGWKLEGTLRAQALSVNQPGLRLDQYYFAMLPDEWRALKRKQEARA